MGRQTPLWIAKSSKDDKMWVFPYFGVSGPQAGPFPHTLARFLPPNGQWEDFPRKRIHSLHGPAREPQRTLNRINNNKVILSGFLPYMLLLYIPRPPNLSYFIS